MMKELYFRVRYEILYQIQSYRSAINHPTHSFKNAFITILTLLLLVTELYAVKEIKESKDYSFVGPVISDECDAVTSTGDSTAKPTYHSLGLYWTPTGGASDKSVSIEYRKKGECTWNDGYPMDYNPISGTTDYRGSIVNLIPDTEYEIRLTLEGTSTTSTIATETWTETPPEGAVTNIATQSATYSITTSGTSDAYRVYDGQGATIDLANNADLGISINASYVILRNINIRNPRIHGIRITGGTDIIIEDCDVSGWGRASGPNGFGENYNSGVYSSVAGLERVTVQRCKFHDPRTDANSWDEDSGVGSDPFHPRGPQCISFFDSAGNHVIRYNECYSDFEHQFNDGFGGGTNGGLVGFPGPDSDIYNNFVSNTWDDGMEIEGGGRNVRVFNNYIENAFIPYADASVTVGPLYMFRNVSGRSDSSNSPSDNSPGYFLKSGHATTDTNMNGNIYLFNNTVTQPGGEGAGGIGTAGSANRHIKHMTSRNNVLEIRSDTTSCFATHALNIDNSFDYDLCSKTFPVGQESNGILGTPIYTGSGLFDLNTKTGDFRLSPTSLGYRQGVIIPNFAVGSSGNPPDMGAQQSSEESAMQYGVTAVFDPEEPEPTSTPTNTPTPTPTPTDEPTPTPTEEPTPTPTDEPTPTPTVKLQSISPTPTITVISQGGIDESETSDSNSCNVEKPSSAPNLFQIDTAINTASLYFSPAGKPYDRYFVQYGVTPSANQFGAEFGISNVDGVIKFIVGDLESDKTYYFIVLAGNGCAPGEWSKVISAKTGKEQTVSSSFLDRINPVNVINKNFRATVVSMPVKPITPTPIPQIKNKEVSAPTITLRPTAIPTPIKVVSYPPPTPTIPVPVKKGFVPTIMDSIANFFSGLFGR